METRGRARRDDLAGNNGAVGMDNGNMGTGGVARPKRPIGINVSPGAVGGQNHESHSSMKL